MSRRWSTFSEISYKNNYMNNRISKSITDKVLMVGNYYKGNAIGGMASVCRVYAEHYESYNYLSSWRDVSKPGKLWYAGQAYVRVLFSFVFNPEIKILHVHVASAASFYRKAKFIQLAKKFKKKIVFHMHSAVFKDYYAESNDKEFLLKIMNMADFFVVLSQSWKEWYSSIGVEANKIIVVNNPVSEPVRYEFECNAPVRMLFLGELLDRKGVWDILKGIVDHKTFFEGKIKFKIGGNKKEDEIKKFIIDNGLQNFVEFEGWVAGEKKWKLLNWANLVILPSFNEGLPITLLEAMAYSCALISTPVGGIPEILHDGENGKMVTPGNSEEIAAAIKYYVDNTDQIEVHGNESYRKVKPFLPETVFGQIETVYGSLL